MERGAENANSFGWFIGFHTLSDWPTGAVTMHKLDCCPSVMNKSEPDLDAERSLSAPSWAPIRYVWDNKYESRKHHEFIVQFASKEQTVSNSQVQKDTTDHTAIIGRTTRKSHIGSASHSTRLLMVCF